MKFCVNCTYERALPSTIPPKMEHFCTRVEKDISIVTGKKTYPTCSEARYSDRKSYACGVEARHYVGRSS